MVRMTIPVTADAAGALDALAAIDRQLGDATARLTDVAARAVGIARQTDWRTGSARRFHAQADEWSRDVAALIGTLDQARTELQTVRHGLQLHAWGWGL